ncbi:MAG TPA: four helix bundle protein [Tepidisphaeraceae bacterium]|nr:four helix bundle protein [Tepidisphaeraceae bacterium]
MNKGDANHRQDLRERTKRFALSVVAMYVHLPQNPAVAVMGRQCLRSGTSVGAHYREACRARSDAEFISKLEGALQELDETAYWLELLDESRLCTIPNVEALHKEVDELIRMFVTMVRNVKGG